MYLRLIDNPDAEPVHMDWDQAQTALRTGGYEIHNEGLMAVEGTRSEKIVSDLPSPAAPNGDARIVVNVVQKRDERTSNRSKAVDVT